MWYSQSKYIYIYNYIIIYIYKYIYTHTHILIHIIPKLKKQPYNITFSVFQVVRNRNKMKQDHLGRVATVWARITNLPWLSPMKTVIWHLEQLQHAGWTTTKAQGRRTVSQDLKAGLVSGIVWLIVCLAVPPKYTSLTSFYQQTSKELQWAVKVPVPTPRWFAERNVHHSGSVYFFGLESGASPTYKYVQFGHVWTIGHNLLKR